jgi:hypothetical protein
VAISTTIVPLNEEQYQVRYENGDEESNLLVNPGGELDWIVARAKNIEKKRKLIPSPILVLAGKR